MKTPSLLRSMLSFSAMTFVSRLLGLLREQVIAGVFGANWMTDAFLVAFRIPNFMRRLFAEGSFSTAFVPVFTEVKETRSHAELRALVSRTAGTLGGVLLVAPEGVVLWSVPVAPVPVVLPLLWSVVLPVVLVPVFDEPLLPAPVPVWARTIAPEITRMPNSVSVLFIRYLARIYLTAPLSSIIRRS